MSTFNEAAEREALRAIENELCEHNDYLPEDPGAMARGILDALKNHGFAIAAKKEATEQQEPEEQSPPPDWAKGYQIAPCPCCGLDQEAINGPILGRGSREGFFKITCTNCSLSITQDRPDKVVGMWNTRTDPAQYNEEAEMKAANAKHRERYGWDIDNDAEEQACAQGWHDRASLDSKYKQL